MKKEQSVLITGGSGLVGRYLTSLLLEKGYKVSHLSRKTNQFGKVRVFRWDPEKEIIDPVVFKGIDYLIHLAGANIGEKRWTKSRKKEILMSRVDSARFLYKAISESGTGIKTIISASATGYYGSVSSDHIFNEDDPPANDFPGTTCKQWEESADLFRNIGMRIVKIRTGVVLEKNDSALSKMMTSAKAGFLVSTGNGRQYMPWIHIHDLCSIYLKAIKDDRMSGAYNAVSPQHVTHLEFIKTLGLVMKRALFPIPLPGFVLQSVLGEMSGLILKGSRVSSEKIIAAGYSFQYINLQEALSNIING